MAQGKKSESSQWIKDYLKSQNVEISNWEEYGPLYNRYSARIRKYNPQNYQQFINLCTFKKQRKNRSGAEDLGDWSRELGGWKKKVEPREPREPKVKPREPREPGSFHPTFNEERYWRDQKQEWKEWKARMARYRDDKIRNLTQQGEQGRLKDYMPYTFKFAIRCLAGVYPIECYPEALEEYKEELMTFTNY